MLCLLVLLPSLPAACQLNESYTYGNRPIDKLPKSHYARPEDERDWSEAALPSEIGLALHPKDRFRIGEQGMERLCVVEAWCPQEATRDARRLALDDGAGVAVWHAPADWVGANRRMRSYWLPVGRRAQRLGLQTPDGGTSARADLTDGAPWALIEFLPEAALHEVDAGFALLPRGHLAADRGAAGRFRVVMRPGFGPGALGELRTWGQPLNHQAMVPPHVEPVSLDSLQRPRVFGATATVVAPVPAPVEGQTVELQAGGAVLARASRTVWHVKRLAEPAFGARYADLVYWLPVKDGDGQRSWHELWEGSDKRDVVVTFPGTDARFVFWRGASYVGCWAFPEAWLTYEWLEAEPYFYGAVDCVEPIMDKDCRYSRAEIVESSPARAVVKWSYALTDFEGKIIRDEHAEETFTFYPDGIGTRFLRGFYRSGWHETQEFIVINRPGAWPSDALSPQAITLLSPSGERQAPVWPKPGFSVEGWPQVISIVRLGDGPFPFMVTPDAPSQVKVWADPYLDKPDLFNSYPHWPVSRGMPTSWLTDPADFARPTHSNLANLVSRPIRETPDEKDFVWLIGVCTSEQQALDAARCWLQPGRIEPGEGVASAEYSQAERAYIVRPIDGARTLGFTLVPEAGTPIVDPALIIEGWEGPAGVSVRGARRAMIGEEDGRLAAWVDGRVVGSTDLVLTRRQ